MFWTKLRIYDILYSSYIINGSMFDPMEAFEVKTIIPINVFGLDISITNSSLYMMLVVCCILLIFSFGLYRASLIPKKLQFCLETLYKFICDLIFQNAGKNGRILFPYIFSIFLFIMLGNIVGLVPFSFSFTCQLVVTFGMAFIVFFASIFLGIRNQGIRYFRHFCPSNMPLYLAPVFTLIELMSFCFRPISLGIRLFANMLSGHLMLEVLASFAASMAGILAVSYLSIVPVVVNVFLNVFKLIVCILQAYVFSVLSCIYLSESLPVCTKREEINGDGVN